MKIGKKARFSVLCFAAALIVSSTSLLNAAPLKTQVEMVINFKGEDRTVVFELDEVKTPRTSQNFRKLCKAGFYNGTLFHRVIPGYIVQAGDPLSKEPAKRGMWGTGGPGYTLKPEFGLPHVRGAIAMARLGDAVNPGKESSGSQFYIALDRIESLDNEYVVFGEVISGMEVMDEIGEASADQNNTPVNEITIKQTTVKGETSLPAAPAPAAEPVPSLETTATPSTETIPSLETAVAPSTETMPSLETPAAPAPEPVPALETGLPPQPAPVSEAPAAPAPEPAPMEITRAPAPPASASSTPPAPAPAPAQQPEEGLTDITPPAAADTPPSEAPEGPLSESELAKSQENKAASEQKNKKQGPLTKFLKRFW